VKLLFLGDLAITGFGSVTTDLGRALIEAGVDARFVSQNQLDALPEPFFSRTFDQTQYQVNAADADRPVRQHRPAPGRLHRPHSRWQGGFLSVLEATRFQTPRLGGSLLGCTSPPRVTGAEASTVQCERLRLANGNYWGSKWKPDAIFLLGDFYGVRLGVTSAGLATFARVPTYHYVPVEGHDLPPLWAQLWATLSPIAMSKFGQAEIAKVIGRVPPLMYHGVDTEMFRPVTPGRPIIVESEKTGRLVLSSKERCKAFFGIDPRMKVILRCDTNMPRKAYPQMLRALEPVLAARPDTLLVLKTSNWDQGGFLPDSISKMSEAVRGRVVVLESSLPRPLLSALYNAADVYASNSAEGFGLTIAEAVACGVPAVGLDYSSVPEVIGPAGTVVPPAMHWDNGYAHYWALPDPAEFGRAVAYLLDHPVAGARARRAGAAPHRPPLLVDRGGADTDRRTKCWHGDAFTRRYHAA
jgi:glycosyltransferase involved in cell wall biosynthesis